MFISQKTHYALRSLVALGAHHGQGPQPIGSIAATQNIPARFLEVILGELKSGGFVESRRGSRGGYQLARPPERLTVGDIIRFVGGPLGPVACADDASDGSCGQDGTCALNTMWQRVHDALSEIYDSTTIADLVEEERQHRTGFVADFCI